MPQHCCNEDSSYRKSEKRIPTKFRITLVMLIATILALAAIELRAQVAPTDSQRVKEIRTIELDRITVTARPQWKNETPGAASYLGVEQLSTFDYANVHRVLSQVGGIYIQEEDGFGLRPNIGMRGTGVARSAKITLMEDGVLAAPAPYSAPAAYYFPTMARMEGVEVRKGSSQIKYGPYTTGGALNLLSARIPFEWNASAKLTAGGFGSEKLGLKIGDTRGQFGYVFQGLIQSNNGFKELPNGMETGFDIQDYVLKLRFQSDSSSPRFQRLEVKAGHYDELSHETYLGLSYDDFNKDPFQRYASTALDQMTADQNQINAKYFTQWSSGWNATFNLYQQIVRRNWYKLDKVSGSSISSIVMNPNRYTNEYNALKGLNTEGVDYSIKANNREYYSRGVQLQVSQQWRWLASSLRYEAGLRFHSDGMDRFQWVDSYRMEETSLLLNREGTPGTDSNRLETATAWAGYSQIEWMKGAFSISPGIRVEHIDLNREDYGKEDPSRSASYLRTTNNTLWAIMPGLGINYEILNGLNLFGGIHKGFAPPSPGSEQGTDAEKSINYELGARLNKQETLSIETALFFNDYDNLLGNDLSAAGGGGGTAQFNAGEVSVWGLEFTSSYEIIALNGELIIPIRLAYTYTGSKFHSTFESDYEPWAQVTIGDELPYLPSHQWHVSGGISKGPIQADVNYRHQSKVRITAGQEMISMVNGLEGQHVVDLSMSYRLNERATLQTHVRNLMNTRYAVAARPAGYRPGMPRMIEAGIRIEF